MKRTPSFFKEQFIKKNAKFEIKYILLKFFILTH